MAVVHKVLLNFGNKPALFDFTAFCISLVCPMKNLSSRVCLTKEEKNVLVSDVVDNDDSQNVKTI